MEYYSAMKKNEMIQFAATWMNLEIIILSEVSQRKTNIWYCLDVESKKRNKWTYLQNRNRLTDIENKLMATKGNWRRDKLGVWDQNTQTTIFIGV